MNYRHHMQYDEENKSNQAAIPQMQNFPQNIFNISGFHSDNAPLQIWVQNGLKK